MTLRTFPGKIGFLSFFLTLFLLIGFNACTCLEKPQSRPMHLSEAAGDYEWNKEIPVKTPQEITNGKLVLFDVSHMSTSGQSDWVIDGGFSDFADALVKEGYIVKEYRGVDKNGDGIFTFYDDRKEENIDKNEWIITYDAIKEADVFVLAESNRPFREDEYDALKTFVDSGKGIYFISDHYNADRNKNNWDSTETFNGYNRSTNDRYNMGGAYGDLRNPQDAAQGWLAETFGVRFRFNAINFKSGASDIRPPAESEGLTKDVGPVLIAAGATLAIVDGSKAKGIVYLSESDDVKKWGHAADSGKYFGGNKEGPFVAISKPGKGKAAFIGDSSPIEDITPKYRKDEGGVKKLHDGWNNRGNAAQLSINIINWLASTEEYVGFGGINHTRGVETHAPMHEVELEQTKPEPWAKPKVDPWDPATFMPGAYGAPKPYGFGGDPINPVKIDFKIVPDFIYPDQPFAVAAAMDIAEEDQRKPQFGIYLEGGLQVGRILNDDGSWSAAGYSDIPAASCIIVVAKAGQAASRMTVKIRLSKKKYVKKGVTGIIGGFGYITGTISAEPGDIVAAVKDEKVVGTARVDDQGKVRIAVKSGPGIKLVLYEPDGKKKADLPGDYEVTDNQATMIH